MSGSAHPTSHGSQGWSIRRRLLAGLLSILFVGLAGGPLVASLLVRDFLQSRAEADLTGAATAIGGFIEARDGVTISRERLDALPLQYGVLLVALDDAGSPLARSDQDSPGGPSSTVDDLVDAASDLDAGQTARATSSDRTYVLTRIPTPGLRLDLGGRDRVAVAELLLARDRTDDALLVRRVEYGGYGFAILALVTLGGVAALVLRRGLRPIEEMADLMRQHPQTPGTDVLEARLATLSQDSAVETQRLATSLAASFAARRRAEEALRAFVADASHELRTPLTTLSGWLDLYAQGGLDDVDERHRAMERMEAEVGRMLVLVAELDLLARLDRGRPLEHEPVVLARLLAGVVDDAAVVSPDRVVTLDCPPDLVVPADRARLEQVFRNLVGNAAQHTPAGTPIHVGCETRTDAGRERAVVRVVDHGPGVPEGQEAQIFERFHRADSTRRDGSGLGLAIVKALVEAHGGQVSTQATDGGGATFKVVLPVGSRDRDEPDPIVR